MSKEAGTPTALLFGRRHQLPLVYPADLIEQIGTVVEWGVPLETVHSLSAPDQAAHPLPPETEVIFSTWGMPTMDEAFLERLPNLKAVFYAAGTVRSFTSEGSWKRGVRVFSAAQANAVPVAEFAMAQIILGLKKAHLLRDVTRNESWQTASQYKHKLYGNFKRRVGLISYGAIARHLRALLQSLSHEVWVYDPFLSEEAAAAEGVRLASLEDLFRECHAVSLHAPWLKETEHLIRGHHLRSMLPDAVFVNTARGAIVHQQEMTEALIERPDILAILDVLYPEPPPADEPLFKLPNACVTPHIAGSAGDECARMGEYAFEAFQKYRAGRPSKFEVFEADMTKMA